ncbi:MAG TPA: Calx-beta domain-containing protein [Planctomycetia bacterium]|nr:Calx-beta domain-containing protein [Planctomycetia bacterium]
MTIGNSQVAEGTAGTTSDSFVVHLASASGASLGDADAMGTTDYDEPFAFISDVSKQERKKCRRTSFTFTVYLSVAYDQNVSLQYYTVNGYATTADKDYVAPSGRLTFAPGETEKTVTIKVLGDAKREENENFFLDLFGAGSNLYLSESRGVGTVLNDD